MPRLWSCSFVCVCLCLLLAGQARAGVLDVQDDDPALVYSGTWFPDASPNAHGKHETWTNASGASVYYDFQGSQVEVFATQRPTGTYLTNVSFQIDDDVPDFWTTNANVTQETFNKLVYTSPGTLSADGSHRITITNYGFVFWLVYLEITTPDVSGGSNTTSTSTATGTGTQTSSAGTSSATPHPNTSSGSASRTPVIIGAVVGSVGGAALLLLAALWVWCVHYSRSRRRALAPTPFAGQADPSAHRPAKDRPPPNAPSRFRRWIAPRSQAAASEPDYGYGYEYPSTGATENAPQPQARGRAADVDGEALKQLAVFRSAAEARAAPAPPPPPLRGPPAASIPTTLETPTAFPSPSPSPRSAALARAFTFSSRLERDPVRARAPPPTDATTMSSALASSGVLPPPSPSPYTPPDRDRDRRGPVFFRVLRRSRDGGVRLAGGPPPERGADADMMAPEEYDERMLEAMGASASEGSTLPPEYQYRQYPAGGGEGGRRSPGAGAGR